MKKLLVILMVLFARNANAQWVWQNPSLQINTLNDCCFADSNTVFAVGDYGTILKSTNAGENWSRINLSYNPTLFRIQFTSINTGYISGDNVLLKTTNSGTNWFTLPFHSTGSPNFLYALHFLNNNTGYISNMGVLQKTTNGGSTWTLFPNLETRIWSGIYASDTNNITVVSTEGYPQNKNIYRTINGGISWNIQTPVTPSTGGNTDVFFLNNDTGFVTGNLERIYRTTNGGNIWDLVHSVSSNAYINKIKFINSQTGFAVGCNYSRLKRTTNCGVNWQSMSYSSNLDLIGVSFSPGQNGLIVGKSGMILRSSNNGTGWNNMYKSVTSASLKRLYHLNDSVIFAIGGGGAIIKTTDRGINWIPKNSGSYRDLYGIFFINPITGWIAGHTGGPSLHGEILKTTNAGENWVIQYSTTSYYLRDVAAINNDTVFSVGRYSILKSTDGGINWYLAFNTPNYEELYSICFVNSLTGFACGSGDLIAKTTNGGVNWSYQIASNYNGTLTRLFFIDTDNGFISSSSGRVLYTSNCGINWVSNVTSMGSQINSIYFINNNTGYIVSMSKIQYTTDRGNLWTIQSIETNTTLYDILMINSTSGYIVGNNGLIMNTINGGTPTGVRVIEEKTKSNFILNQNYPNPFNPNTVIRYQLPVISNVVLKVYDLMGREVQTLVNERLQAGTYETAFDGSRLSSGVYFYKMVTDEYSETRRMVLIK